MYTNDKEGSSNHEPGVSSHTVSANRFDIQVAGPVVSAEAAAAMPVSLEYLMREAWPRLIYLVHSLRRFGHERALDAQVM